MKHLTHILIFCTLFATAWAQDNTTRILSPSVRTLRMQMVNHPTLFRPVLTLPVEGIIDGTDPDNTLEISFDEISHDVHQYTYTVRHLNADLQPSDLQSFEYVHGFTTADITDYEHSLNTQVNYTHYSFTFPNEDMQIIHSGLYLLMIYEDAAPENIVAQQLFAVVEPKASISTDIRSNTTLELSGHYQQLDIDVDTKALNMRMPDDIHLCVMQNGRWDNRVLSPKANYVETNRLRWRDNNNLIFEGGNEYHRFDAYSVYFAGTNIDNITYQDGDYHCFLMPDQIGSFQYIHDFDADGQFIVNAERTDDSDTEAEYMWVHFFLQSEPLFDGSIFVGGDLFQNHMSLSNRMLYDNAAGGYYLNALVKQGGYNYQYWFRPKQKAGQPYGLGLKGATLRKTEGSHWETGNTYETFVFFRPFGARADRLVGYSSSSM